SRKYFALQEEGLAVPTKAGSVKKNIQHLLLVEFSNVLLPPLHIKLGLAKNFHKARDQMWQPLGTSLRKKTGISAAKIEGSAIYTEAISSTALSV
ncbi:hypothetical protein Cfor_08270, partial [Coptotermes formosanus]